MNFGETITKLRNEAGLSQQEVADNLQMARATYASLEVNRRDPNLAEIRNIAEFYQINPSDIINGDVGQVNEPTAVYNFKEKASDISPREIVKSSPEKLREVLLYVLGKVGAKPNVGETVLYKLLYFIDFDYYEKHGKSVTGLTYVRNHFGPTPNSTFESVVAGMVTNKELEIVKTKFFNNLQRKYLPTVSSDLHKLDASELRHIDEELMRLSDKNATELSDFSHKDMPWIATEDGKPIDYQLAMYRTDATSVKDYEDDL